MYLLYLDESGSPDDNTQPFVVGGLAIQANSLNGIRRDVEAIVAKRLDPHLHGLELHATEVLGGRGGWRGIPPAVRKGVADDVVAYLGQRQPTRRLFAVAREPGAVNHADPVERVFEELLLRFSTFVRKTGNAELGLVIADDAKYEKILQPLAQAWRETGTRFGTLTNIAEVPLFVNSKATRLIQMADFVAHAVFRFYRPVSDPALLTALLPAFDAGTDGKLHGLTHLTLRPKDCGCPACTSRNKK
jgi:hypothetical protein